MAVISNREFFDSASLFYDKMINAEKSLRNKSDLFKQISTPGKKAADLGCGTGIDSIALALNGFEVDAFDISGSMIEKAKINCEQKNVPVNFFKHQIHLIPPEFNEQYNIIVSLGNTMANIDLDILEKSLKRIRDLLITGGKAIFQILNFDRILNQSERIISVTKNESDYFIRFYDFLESSINFNIMRFDKNNLSSRSIITTTLYPHTYRDIDLILNKIGFKKIEYFGGLNRIKFDRLISKDLVVEIQK